MRCYQTLIYVLLSMYVSRFFTFILPTYYNTKIFTRSNYYSETAGRRTLNRTKKRKKTICTKDGDETLHQSKELKTPKGRGGAVQYMPEALASFSGPYPYSTMKKYKGSVDPFHFYSYTQPCIHYQNLSYPTGLLSPPLLLFALQSAASNHPHFRY